METTTFTQSNYVGDYNTLQLSLPLDLGLKINPDNEVVSFLKVLEGVNLCKYLKRKEHRGRKGHDKVMLLKIILFSYFLNERDTRKMAELCRNDIRYMYLAQESTPSHMAFERLITNYLRDDIDQIFFDISLSIGEKMNINTDIQYIDGTKIEANANKNTFVYKKRILNAREKLFSRIDESINELNRDFNHTHQHKKFYCAMEMGYIAQYLLEVIIREKLEIVYGKGKRKSTIQKYYDEFIGYFVKLYEYETWIGIIGDARNSCSKTDHDATMCATKIDYYCNTGISKPCYNAQIAVSDGIIMNASLFQKPGDTNTLIPFLEYFHDHVGRYPKYVVADAAYGSYDNYMFCTVKGINPLLKYNLYAAKNTKKFKKNIYNTFNWEKNEMGYKICPNGNVFDQYIGETYDERGKYLRIIHKLTSKEVCGECPHKENCCKNERKVVSRDAVLDEFYAEADKNLSTEFGKEQKKQRSIQAEGAFGVLKYDRRFTRFTRRGMDNVKMEFLLICLGYNINKYHLFRVKNSKDLDKEPLIN